MCDGADLVCAQSNFLAIWTARRTPAFSRWASALVDHQGLDDQDKLVEYDDELIEGTCKAVRKPSSGQDGHQIPEIVAHRLQLVVYFAKHRERTQRELNVRVTDLNALLSLKDQRIMKKNWTKQNPEHKPDAVVLDAQEE
jgi:hypothetical protein